MAAADRLSALPDSALLQVLSFLPAGAAARTSALSRRWRGLWLQADAVNLDTGSYGRYDDHDGRMKGRWLFRDAIAAVTAGGRRRCPVRKLSVLVSSSNHMDYCEDVMRTSPGMDAVLAAPATRRLEELRLVLRADFSWRCGYELPITRRLLPCAASLRVLELAGCALGPPPAAGAAFVRLDTLRLTLCSSSPENLQAVLDAAPSLATLFLDNISFTTEEELGGCGSWYEVMRKRRFLLRCPRSVSAVTLLRCHDTDGLDLDARGVRFLRYEGYLDHFPFTSASGMPANLEHAELRFCAADGTCRNPPSSEEEAQPPHAMFWESIGSFSRLRFLKLKLLDINDIAVHPEQEATFLKQFPDLKFLKLKGSYENDKRGAAVAIANFLHCCPALQELRLKFKIHGDPDASPKVIIHLSEGRKAQLGLEKSMELLKRLKSETSTSACYGVDDDDRCCDDVDLSALQARRFPCLESHLRKIRLKFELQDFNCFEVKIAKFLVENAVVLEAMQVHDGDQRVCDHIHRKLAIWRAGSSNSKIDIVGEKVKTRPLFQFEVIDLCPKTLKAFASQQGIKVFS
ncbi:hypothetical protein EJB05_39205, partial [Eragrostis curvula]